MGAFVIIAKVLAVFLSVGTIGYGIFLIVAEKPRTINVPGLDLSGVLAIEPGQLPTGILVAGFGVAALIALSRWRVRAGHVMAEQFSPPTDP